LQRFGRAAFERRFVSCRNDLIVGIEHIDPRLQQIDRLREHEPRAATLVVRKRALDVVDANDAWRGRPSVGGDPDKWQRRRVESDSLTMLLKLLACGAVTIGRRAAEDENVHDVGWVGWAW
jgi:hypothetical protein